MLKIEEKNWQELRNMAINKVEWFINSALKLTLSNGESCTAGAEYDLADSHTFDPN
jgi:hypothetical protein